MFDFYDGDIMTNGGEASPSKKIGDGDFCPECKKNNFFNWVKTGNRCDNCDDDDN